MTKSRFEARLKAKAKSVAHAESSVMYWQLSHRADPLARVIADRHYSRQKPGSRQFVPPGRCIVLVIPNEAYWVTSYPYEQYVKHAWAGAWLCSAFRNEGYHLSSMLILQAIAATKAVMNSLDNWDLPDLGMITFVDQKKIRSKRDPGRCFVKAGFKRLEERTKGNLIVFQLLPHQMPASKMPIKEIDK